MFLERFRQAHKQIRNGRRRRATAKVEALEMRQLLTYSPIGSLPSLQVSAQAGAIAAYGGPITVTLDVSNVGASSTVEPLNLAPDSTSTADAPAGRLDVFLLPNRRTRPGGPGSVLIGDIDTPAIPQNSLVRVTDTLTMPNRPRGFKGSGSTVFLGFRPRGGLQTILKTKNASAPVPVQINAALPDLVAIGLDLPARLEPGDVVAPVLKIANYGTVNTNTQGAVTVILVASTDKFYGPTDLILARYAITSLPGLSEAPSRRLVIGDVNIDDPANVIAGSFTTSGQSIAALPVGSRYFVGLVIDPLNEIRELQEVGQSASSELQLAREVNVVDGLPPAGVLSAPAPIENQFPFPAYAPLVSVTDFLANPLPAVPTSSPVVARAASVKIRSFKKR